MTMIIRRQLCAMVHQKLKGSGVTLASVQDAFQEILFFLREELDGDCAVSIPNFGTLSPYLMAPRPFLDFGTGEIRRGSGPVRKIRLAPATVFSNLIRRKKSAVRKSKFSR